MGEIVFQYFIFYLVTTLIYTIFIESEVKGDAYTIRKGLGDKHLWDVVKYTFYTLLVTFILSFLVTQSWGPFVFVLQYYALRFFMFNTLLNYEMGWDEDYLSDRGFDKLIKWVPFNILQIIRFIILLVTFVGGFSLYLYMNSLAYIL